jgi:hypothetical protein
MLLSYLPISIAAWDIRAGSMAVAIGFLGVSANDAVFVGLALGSLGLVSALLGVLVWLIGPIPVSVLGRQS